MSDPALALQDGIEAALRASVAVKTAMGLGTARIYPLAPPDGAPFPYITIGDDQIIGDDTECSANSEAFTSIHIWSRIDDDVTGSRAQAKAIAGAVRTTITRALTVLGFEVVECEFRSAQHLTDPDRRTAHSVVEHRLLLDPA